MKLTVQEVHTYNNLVKDGIENPIQLAGADFGDILIPSLDDNDELYFENITSNDKIYPGINTIEKIKEAVDKLRNN